MWPADERHAFGNLTLFTFEFSFPELAANTNGIAVANTQSCHIGLMQQNSVGNRFVFVVILANIDLDALLGSTHRV